MKIVSALSLAFLSVVLCGCASSGGSAEVDALGNSVVEPAALPGASDYPVPEPDDFNVSLVLISDAIDSQLMSQSIQPQVIFTVWGFDELAADVSATNIHESRLDLRPQSVPYYLGFSDTDINSVEFQSGSPDSLKYYVTMAIDVDGDDKVCNGDYRQDYSQSPPERFAVTQTDVNLEVFVSEVSGEICAE